MNWTISPFAVPLILGAPILLTIVAVAWQRRHQPGATPLAIVSLATLIYSLGYVGELGASALEGVKFWLPIEYIGAAAAPVLAFCIVWLYIQQHQRNARPIGVFFAIVPAITLLLAFTNDHHGLIWQDMHLIEQSGQLMFDFTPGAWYWVKVAFDWSLMAAGLALILIAAARTSGLYRRQYLLMSLAFVPPFAFNVAYVFDLTPPGVDVNPYALILTSVIIALALFQGRLFSIVPVARDAVFSSIADAVLIVDGAGLLVDLNPSAQALFEVDPHVAIGKPAREVFADFPGIHRALDGQRDRHEITLTLHGKSPRVVQCTRSGLERGGVILVLTDITERVLAEHNVTELNEQLAWLASHDSLTRLHNRRVFDEELSRYFHGDPGSPAPLALIMADIDHFKHVNDKYGHAAGDLVLQEVAGRMRSRVASDTLVCRYGGEEFMLLMPDTNIDQALDAAEDLRLAIDALGVPWHGTRLSVTMSFGVAVYPNDATDMHGLLLQVDTALYGAKQAGRNRTMHVSAAPRLP